MFGWGKLPASSPIVVGRSTRELFVLQVMQREASSLAERPVDVAEILALIAATPPEDEANMMSSYVVRASYLRVLFARDLELLELRQTTAC